MERFPVDVYVGTTTADKPRSRVVRQRRSIIGRHPNGVRFISDIPVAVNKSEGGLSQSSKALPKLNSNSTNNTTIYYFIEGDDGVWDLKNSNCQVAGSACGVRTSHPPSHPVFVLKPTTFTAVIVVWRKSLRLVCMERLS